MGPLLDACDTVVSGDPLQSVPVLKRGGFGRSSLGPVYGVSSLDGDNCEGATDSKSL